MEEINKFNIKLNNLGTINKNKVTLNFNSKGTIILFFSYETIVSFSLLSPRNSFENTIKNYWKTTTGKFLNELEPDKTKRLNQEDFNKQLFKAFKILNL